MFGILLIAANHRQAVVLKVVALLAAAALLAATGAAAEPTPPAAAALEEMPSATRDDVVRALRKVRRKYGEDAAVIETQLLINAMRHGSVRATTVSVDGVKPYRGKRYLGFSVETGLIFDSQTRDVVTRIHILWSGIMVPTIERLASPRIPADGIKVALQYHHRPYKSRDELRTGMDRPGTSEETVFYLLTPDLTELAARHLTTRDLIARARISVDGKERDVEIADPDPPEAPGPE